MLNVYAVSWCPHCQKTVEFLDEKQIDYTYIDIEAQPDDVVKMIVDVNGGIDWVAPTLEFNGKWRKGKVYNARELSEDLLDMGVIT